MRTLNQIRKDIKKEFNRTISHSTIYNNMHLIYLNKITVAECPKNELNKMYMIISNILTADKIIKNMR